MVLLNEAEQRMAGALTEVHRVHGERVSLADWVAMARLFGVPLATAHRDGQFFTANGYLDWTKIDPVFWVSEQESTQTALELLLALHPDADEIREGLAGGVPQAKLQALYGSDTNQMVRTVYERLQHMLLEEFLSFWGALPLPRANLSTIMHSNWAERSERVQPLAYSRYRAVRGWVRLHVADSTPLQELESAQGTHEAAYREDHLLDVVANVFYWQRERSVAADGFATLHGEVNHIRLTQGFLAALAAVLGTR